MRNFLLLYIIQKLYNCIEYVLDVSTFIPAGRQLTSYAYFLVSSTVKQSDVQITNGYLCEPSLCAHLPVRSLDHSHPAFAHTSQ